MSYSIKVTVNDGTPVISPEGTVVPPDGIYVINGHEPVEGTWQAEQIRVSRYNADNQLIISAESVCPVK